MRRRLLIVIAVRSGNVVCMDVTTYFGRIHGTVCTVFLQSRRRIGSEKVALAFATFEDGSSRALDPQLHTHCVLLNIAVRTASREFD